MSTELVDAGKPCDSLDQILKMQDIMFASGAAEEMPVQNFFAPHVYYRQITMRKDLLVIGKMHKTRHLNIIIAGDVSIKTSNGIERVTIQKYPCIFVSEPGVKKVLYCHEDTIWGTIHPTDTTDMEELERELIIPDSDLRDEQGKILLDDEQLQKLLGVIP